MKLTEARKYLEEGFKNKFGNLKKRKYWFFKDIGELYFRFGVVLVNSDNSFPSTFGCGFGNIHYSNLFNFIIRELKINRQENKYITVYNIGQIPLYDRGEYPVLEYDIYTEQDANKMVEEVSDYILNTVLPEWEANPTLEYLEKKVNENLNEAPNFSGLILAKLIGSSNYEHVKEHLIEVSKDWADWDKKDLDKVINFLETESLDNIKAIAYQ